MARQCGCDDPLLLWQFRHASGTRSLGRDLGVAGGGARCEERRGMATLSCASYGPVAAAPVGCRLFCITSGCVQELTVSREMSRCEIDGYKKVTEGRLPPAS